MNLKYRGTTINRPQKCGLFLFRRSLIFAAAVLTEVIVAFGGEVFHKHSLDEGIASFETMGDGIFILDFDKEVAFVVGVIVVVRIDDANLITEANVVFEAGFAADDKEKDFVGLEAGLETGRELDGLAWLKLEVIQ